MVLSLMVYIMGGNTKLKRVEEYWKSMDYWYARVPTMTSAELSVTIWNGVEQSGATQDNLEQPGIVWNS